jgi:ribonuclease BN (tRNA processing enzyme)
MPTTNPLMAHYGGNTSCIEIRSPLFLTDMLLFDGGTGLIAAGEWGLKNNIQRFHIFLSHMHFDHILGFLQFAPFFRGNCDIHIYSESKQNMSLREMISNVFRAPFFPVEFEKLPCFSRLHFHELNLQASCLKFSEFEEFKNTGLKDIRVEYMRLNHPQGALAYKIWSPEGSQNVVYATDHEHGTSQDEELISFIQNTNMFIYDSTYSTDNYKNYTNWGHSTAQAGATFAHRAQVKKYAIFHHDPASTDEYLEKIVLQEARHIFKNSFLSQEGLEVDLLAALKN